MYPGAYIEKSPERPAVITAESGEAMTFLQLEMASRRLARAWYDQGLRPGDHVAVFMENHPRYFEAYWAAIRSGLYLTPVNRYLTAEEAAYVVHDCGARSLITSVAKLPVAEQMVDLTPRCTSRLVVDGDDLPSGFLDLDAVTSSHPAERLEHEPRGRLMFYSSGTTGRPKGIKRPLTGELVSDPEPVGTQMRRGLFDIVEGCVYLSPAPLYHAAPLAFTAGTQAEGGTVVMMQRFDAERSLEFIERYRATTSQWVPTMFSRMLKLPESVRNRYDVSSLDVAVHAAAPCPIEVKRQMIEWWGPILREYYAGSEGNGTCFIDSHTWLKKPGSVGQPVNAVIHVCDDDGNQLPPGQAGTIYFEQPEEEPLFEYHNDPEKTQESRNQNQQRWTTLGDIGYVDEDGFLFLTDRKAFMIISGGVNIYPQEIENALVMHPKVLDVAVIGVPNEDLGEEVKAIVQTPAGVEESEELAEELLAFCRESLAGYKVPKSIDFTEALPRLPTGKLYKKELRKQYWPEG